MNPGLFKTYIAGGDISARRIVKFGVDDERVTLAAAGTDAVMGVTGELDVLSGERVDVILTGAPWVKFGGTVTRGGLVTSDAAGKAVAAASDDRVLGVALASAVDGDIAPVLLAPSIKP